VCSAGHDMCDRMRYDSDEPLQQPDRQVAVLVAPKNQYPGGRSPQVSLRLRPADSPLDPSHVAE